MFLEKYRNRMFPEPTSEEVVSEAEMLIEEMQFYLAIYKSKKYSDDRKKIAIERLKTKVKWLYNLTS